MIVDHTFSMDLAKNGTISFLFGLRDTFVGCIHAIRIVLQNKEIRGKVVLCFLLNGVILASSVVLFEQLILPLVLFLIDWSAGMIKSELSQSHLEWVESVISYTFTGLWMLPMIVITTPINSLWVRDIAAEANKHVIKQTRQGTKKPRWGIKEMITDLLYSISIEIVFAIQASLIGFLPVCGWLVGVLHMSVLYSLYSFEYKWFYQGVAVQKRLSVIEANWAYFLGYGLPLSSLISTPLLSPIATGGSIFRHKAGNIVLSASVFALAFPLMVLGSFSVSHPDTRYVRLSIFKLARLASNALFKFLLSSN